MQIIPSNVSTFSRVDSQHKYLQSPQGLKSHFGKWYTGVVVSDIYTIFFIPKLGEMIPNLTFAYFSDGLVQPPTGLY